MPRHSIQVVGQILLGLSLSFGTVTAEETSVEALLAETTRYLGSEPQRAVVPLEKLKSLQTTLTRDQDDRYHLSFASSLGYRGKHAERIALVRSIFPKVTPPGLRANFLYELIDAHTALGQYEDALQSMNESILLVPLLKGTGEKITALQGALTLLSSLRAYDEALRYAERIYSLRGDTVGSPAACIGLGNHVEIYFMRGDSSKARALVGDAIHACEASKYQLIGLIIKALSAIDEIDSGNHLKGIATSLPLFTEFSVLSKDSDYVTQLEEAVARAYLKTGNAERAEYFGLRAYQRAQSGRVLALQEKTSETMAAIRRAQGQLAAAIGYYDINQALKKKVLDDQLHKNLAYQRVKFDSQDKANQVALLEQKNTNLRTEKALQQNKYQNLILLLTLSAVVLAIVGVWLFNALRLKNIFRASAQVDGLTQVSNRTHFTVSAQQAFNDRARDVSLVLFDMDFFKKINDTYGHPTGDWVLKTVCDTVKLQLPKTCQLGRLGGEEFAICMPLLTEQEACALAERCRAAIAEIGPHPSGLLLEIKASFGVATRGAHQPESFEETLVQADKALYLSKNEGRNRVTVYQHSGAYPT